MARQIHGSAGRFWEGGYRARAGRLASAISWMTMNWRFRRHFTFAANACGTYSGCEAKRPL